MTSAPASIVKLLFLLFFAGFGIFAFLFANRYGRIERFAKTATKYNLPPVIALAAVLLPILGASLLLVTFAAARGYPLLAATATGVTIFALWQRAWKNPRTLPSAAAAIVLTMSLAWWRLMPNVVAPLTLAGFAGIFAVLMIGLSDPGHRISKAPVVLFVTFLTIGCLLLVDLGGYRSGGAGLELLAHHWGAYIGPVLQLKAGLVPFYDIPLQYGLGPTLAIVMACRDTGCWTGMEIVVVLSNLLSALLILRMALATTRPRGLVWLGTISLIMFSTLFLWTGAPADGSWPLAVPSVGGIRFLPVVAVTYLLCFGYPAGAAAAFIPAVMWSPESAAMSLVVYGLCETARIGWLKATIRSAGLLVGAYVMLFVAHRMIYGVWIDPAAFAEYVLHVPGPLPIYPISDALLLVVMLGLGGWLLVRAAPDPIVARHDRAVTFLLFAASSYWLGRSHPNNICNLAPFLALVAIRALDRPAALGGRLTDAAGAGLVASVAALTLSPWNSIPFDPRATLDIHALVAKFGTLEPDIARIRAQIRNPDALGIADFGPSYIRDPSETLVWTPMDPSSLWSFVPSERRQLYIRRSAARLRRSGWAIFDGEERFLFDDLQAGYIVARQYSIEEAPSASGEKPPPYLAVCFNPRSDVSASLGPSCPIGQP
jgi:hypothetical protein